MYIHFVLHFNSNWILIQWPILHSCKAEKHVCNINSVQRCTFVHILSLLLQYVQMVPTKASNIYSIYIGVHGIPYSCIPDMCFRSCDQCWKTPSSTPHVRWLSCKNVPVWNILIVNFITFKLWHFRTATLNKQLFEKK